MPKDPRIKKVLVIGSGPIIIGQAAEFDYSGTQACRALKAEGIETVLLNSNPATIMTDPDVADHVYIEPMTLEVVERILEIEKPDSVLPNLGGQMGLNLSMELARSGYLDRTGIRLLACKPETIDRAEDRELFKETMEKLHQPIIPSEVVETLQDALACADRIGYPVIVRPAFTMGGTGGGICETREKLIEIGTNGLRLSPIHQILVEKCIAGWKEIEYEVMRDHKGNVITVCNMENLDPVGIHTGDSVVVAPSQTLTDHEYQMLRTAAEYDNYRKRSAREADQKFNDGVSHAVNQILAILDTLDMAANAECTDENYKKGVVMTLDKAEKALKTLNITEIESMGKPFDPNFMNAVQQVPAEDGQESGTVVRVFQKGYMIGDKIIRHATVVVAE